jgi:hypothetical protein
MLLSFHQPRHPPLRNLWPLSEVREPIGDALQIHCAFKVFAVAVSVCHSDSAGHAKRVYVFHWHVIPGLQPAESPDLLETPSGRFGNLGLRNRSAVATGEKPANKGRELVKAGEVRHGCSQRITQRLRRWRISQSQPWGFDRDPKVSATT